MKFVEFDPFNIACFDTEKGFILLDRRLKGKPYLDIVVSHELRHEKAKGADWTDLLDFRLLPFYWDILKFKPLWILSSFMPFILYRKRKGWEWGIDPFRLLADAILASVIGATLILRGVLKV